MLLGMREAGEGQTDGSLTARQTGSTYRQRELASSDSITSTLIEHLPVYLDRLSVSG
jgi:hypothetical protein